MAVSARFMSFRTGGAGDRLVVKVAAELIAYLGLVPSEYSSGPSVRRGAITKAGNPHARRLLAEAAWAYQGIPRIGRQHGYRQEGLPKVVCDIAWAAQLRLTTRFRASSRAAKPSPRWRPPSRVSSSDSSGRARMRSGPRRSDWADRMSVVHRAVRRHGGRVENPRGRSGRRRQPRRPCLE